MTISIFVLTFNEGKNINRCLASIHQWCDDIVIVDSGSTDKTLDICKQFSARIFHHDFENHALQCNWALENVPFKYDWILRLDSDEVVPKALREELQQLIPTLSDDVTGIYLNRRMYFMNRWLKHGRMYPHFILRVFRKGCGYYENKTEEHFLLTSGRAVQASHDFLEDNRNNTLRFFTEKHLDLADGETRDTLALSHQADDCEIKPRLFGSKVERTRWLKTNVYHRVPLFLRPWLYFCYRYFLCLGFMDGKPGLIFHTLQAFWYRFYVDSRIYEERSEWHRNANHYDDIE